jgi:hypothetical protein
VKESSKVSSWIIVDGERAETHVILKVTDFWDVAPCILIEIGRRFRGAYCLRHQDDGRPNNGRRKDLWNVSFYETARPNIPEVSHLHIRRRKNLNLTYHWRLHLLPLYYLESR